MYDIEEGRDKLLTYSCVVDPRSVDVLRVLCWTNIFIVVNLDAFREYHHVHNAYDSSITCITNIHDIKEG